LDQLSISSKDLSEMVRLTIAKGCSFRFKAKGNSMHPFIRHNDIITIGPMKDFSDSLGAVVAIVGSNFERTDHLIVHRIVSICCKDEFLIKGDNHNHSDGIFHGSDILGEVINIKRNGQPANFGIGKERYAIAFLSKSNVLLPVVKIFKKVISPFIKGKKSEAVTNYYN
jgi:hypothetical protein